MHAVPIIIKVSKEDLQVAPVVPDGHWKRYFGTVYHGQLKQEQVAIKVLYSSEV